jgi:uncharacterized protein (PEP-CTERM system associated)
MATEVRVRVAAWRWAPVAFAAACVAEPALAQQTVRISAEIQASLAASDNSNLRAAPNALSDLTLDLSGNFAIQARGARYTLDGRLGLSALAYARQSSGNQLLPAADLLLKTTVVDRWLYLDTQLQVDQTAADPFASLVDNGSTVNRVTSVRYRLSPYLSHEFSPTLSMSARYDRSWVLREGRDTTSERRDAGAEEALFSIDSKPMPFGWGLELARQDTAYAGDATSVLASTSLRATASYAPSYDWTLGVVGGRERTRYAFTEQTDSLYGVRLKYRPSERSSLELAAEHRFFGTGLDLSIGHRSPFFSLFGRWVRRPSALPSSQTLAGAGSTSALLDAMLTTREPDPVQRAIRVRDLMSALRLPDQLSGPIEVYIDSARLEQGVDVTAAFQGRLTTATVSAYVRKLEPLPRGDVLPTPLDDQSSRQAGLSLNLSRRLTPALVADAQLRFSRIDGLGTVAGQRTDERIVGVSVSRQLSPKTTVTAALRRQVISTTVPGVESATANTLTVALGHRF